MKFSLCKQQYIYLALAALSLALAITTRVFAEEVVSPAQPNVSVGEVQELGTVLEIRTQDRIVNLTHNVTGKMGAAVARMEQIIGRLEARVQIEKARGVDTAEVERAIESAKNSLQFAKNKLPVLNAFVIEGVSSADPEPAFTDVKSELISIRDAIRNAHSILLHALSTLKEAVVASDSGTGESNVGQDEKILDAGENPPESQ